MRPEDEVRAEVHALWAAVFGEPPIVEAPTGVLLDILVGSLPPSHYATIKRLGVISPFGRTDPAPQSVQGDSSGPSA